MVLGAIVVVAPGSVGGERNGSAPDSSWASQHGAPLACFEILGRSVLERSIDQLRHAGMRGIIVLIDRSFVSAPDLTQVANDYPLTWVDNPWQAAAQMLKPYQECGIDQVFILRAGPYVEVDLTDLAGVHGEQGLPLTRCYSGESALDVWIGSTEHAARYEDLREFLEASEQSEYAVTGYVNRLQSAGDVRRLVIDALTGRCQLRACGSETRPGVWMEEGAQVHRGARIVAPVFLGRYSRIEQQCLITRCSNIESNCLIDYGTVIEDSSVLANSCIGIGLDISHSVVNGSSLVNLEHEVSLEIRDPGMIRQNRVSRGVSNRPVAVSQDGEEEGLKPARAFADER